MKQKKENLFYVGIENPNEPRKALLESLKSIIQMLKEYESLDVIRTEKKAVASQLKETVTEISKMIARIKSEFPRPEFKEVRELVGSKKPATHTLAKPEHGAAVPLHRRLSEVDKLEKELSDVEERLRRLG